MNRVRPHLTYANVMSTIAVFGVLGGGAWAASKIDTNQIENGAVTAKKLHKKAVTTKKIKNEAVTGDKAKESSFARCQVPLTQTMRQSSMDGRHPIIACTARATSIGPGTFATRSIRARRPLTRVR